MAKTVDKTILIATISNIDKPSLLLDGCQFLTLACDG
jgi:hypothetical protein